ncbi:ABC transporter ATP-binding protein [Antrihabitans cavernicola]|uniref:ABC transporter ATP-binding protein n=1 Tax=Antrihabitans cavernicola TaxID=2495913 RepID=A0A5A7S3J2_9NOCA|nr:ABC transporter ATP-binding protein [Spelaeibacter cavernicola]KAA0019455.1 ABC transporter ATP-binding protein [Spelaeibacter cavernicola]
MSLTLTDVTLTYPDGRDRIVALESVDLDVRNGEFVAVTGPSGSGKSSLLAVAGTLATPDSGSVTIDDMLLDDLSSSARARVRRDHIGFVFQQDNLLPALTVLDQLLLTAVVRGRKPARQRAEAMALLDEVGLAEVSSRRPHELSGGMRQRVNIARALMGSPSVLLIDEPTSALDSERGRSVITLLGTLVRERDLAAVLVTHDLASLATDVDSVVTMRDGRITPGRVRMPSPDYAA